MQHRANPVVVTQHYRQLELQSRVESANPHGLVALLYEELLRSLDLALAKASAGKPLSGNGHVAKARSILVALESSLDLTNGGELAISLARIYRACSHGLNEAAGSADLDKLSDIRSGIGDLAYAWQALSER